MSAAIDEQLYGVDMFGHTMRGPVASPVSQKFLVPPFTVLNAREGDWQERKRAWMAMGIKGELGRDAAAYGDVSQWQSRAVKGTNCTTGKNSCMLGITQTEDGGQCVTSIFDPVICELAYRWFTAEGWQVVDPFAGGSVRGVVASCLGRRYWGGELRSEQVDANQAQAETICANDLPVWVCGDSSITLDDAPTADFVFSCPPYGNLEVYSDDPQDLSAMDHASFLVAYRSIIAKSCAKLKPNRFACFVVGDFRCKKGNYRNFVSDTISAFIDAGMELYNEAILVTSVGTACMRVTKQFEAGRKFAKTHQNVLVFVKGCGKRATQEIGSAIV